MLAFDTEFVGEDAYRPELCLVQVATPDRLFVIDPFGCGPLDDFWRLLLAPGRTVVVHAGREDVRMCYFAVGSPLTNLFDVQIAAGLVGLGYPIGYAALVMEVLGQRMHKGETLTDWRRRPLRPEQMRYAFDDVRYLLPAWRRLSDRLEHLGRASWAAEEFAAFSRRAVADDLAQERWRKLKGLGALDRRGLAVAREVYAWRDGMAERANRPVRSLLRDDILTEIARRADAPGGPPRPPRLLRRPGRADPGGHPPRPRAAGGPAAGSRRAGERPAERAAARRLARRRPGGPMRAEGADAQPHGVRAGPEGRRAQAAWVGNRCRTTT